jgi:hypothetical protein
MRRLRGLNGSRNQNGEAGKGIRRPSRSDQPNECRWTNGCGQQDCEHETNHNSGVLEYTELHYTPRKMWRGRAGSRKKLTGPNRASRSTPFASPF